MCRVRRWLTLEEAIHKVEEPIHKVTQWPADRFHISDRGVLRPGAFADIVVFDPTIVDSPATYETPDRPPTGIRYVFRNGRLLES